MSYIGTSEEGHIGTIIFSNQRKRNCFPNELCEEMIATLKKFKKDKIRAVIIRSETIKRETGDIWSSGFNIDDLPEPRRAPLSYKDPLEKLIRKIEKYPGAVIAMVDGGVWGGACELVGVCDLVIGSHAASFKMTPVILGIPYNLPGIMHFVNRVGFMLAKEILITAEVINAERAYEIHLLNYLVPQEELETFTYELAGTISKYSPRCITATKEMFRILSEAYPITPINSERSAAYRRIAYDGDYEIGLRAFHESREAEYPD